MPVVMAEVFEIGIGIGCHVNLLNGFFNRLPWPTCCRTSAHTTKALSKGSQRTIVLFRYTLGIVFLFCFFRSLFICCETLQMFIS